MYAVVYLLVFLLVKEIFQHYLQDKQKYIVRTPYKNIHQGAVSMKDLQYLQLRTFLFTHLQDLTVLLYFFPDRDLQRMYLGLMKKHGDVLSKEEYS